MARTDWAVQLATRCIHYTVLLLYSLQSCNHNDDAEESSKAGTAAQSTDRAYSGYAALHSRQALQYASYNSTKHTMQHGMQMEAKGTKRDTLCLPASCMLYSRAIPEAVLASVMQVVHYPQAAARWRLLRDLRSCLSRGCRSHLLAPASERMHLAPHEPQPLLRRHVVTPSACRTNAGEGPLREALRGTGVGRSRGPSEG